MRLSRIRRPTYSGYMVEKTHISRIDSKLIKANFKPNFGYMCFFNYITTVRRSTNLSQARGCLVTKEASWGIGQSLHTIISSLHNSNFRPLLLLYLRCKLSYLGEWGHCATPFRIVFMPIRTAEALPYQHKFHILARATYACMKSAKFYVSLTPFPFVSTLSTQLLFL